MLETGNNPLTNKRLSIRVSADGFSFFTDGQRHAVDCSHATLIERLDEELRKYALLNNDFQQVQLLCDTPSTRIPLNEFKSEEVQSLYRLTYGQDSLQGLALRYEVLPTLELVELFAVEPDVEQTVLKHYPQAVTHSLCGQVLLEGLEAEAHMPMGKRRMHASVAGTSLMLFTFVDNRLHYCNSFPVSEAQGRMYYTLYVWTHMELAQERDILVVHGHDEAYIKALKQFIRDIQCV